MEGKSLLFKLLGEVDVVPFCMHPHSEKEAIELIEETEYGRAFRLIRSHKIDINLLYDVNPEKFMQNIPKFVKEVKQVDYLNLFINSLKESDRGKELDFLHKFFVNNSFPKHLFDIICQKILNEIFYPSPFFLRIPRRLCIFRSRFII